MKISLGSGTHIDLTKLVVSRMLLQANSGGGKSWALRRILEQSHGHVQQLVIDIDDEFYTLREKFDYILVRKDGGDCIPEVRSAGLLAHRLLELGVSAIISIYEMKHHERIAFMKAFLDALVNAPKKLWHPALIVVDEAHVFCPEKDKAESAGSVIDLMTRGRKRGFCGILATQRISKLAKDAAAETNNKLIGRASLDVDMKRAADEIGFTTRDDQHSLRQLHAGEFFAFGPAISDTIVRVKVGAVKTTHPKAGAGVTPISPPKNKVQKVLAQLADLPQEAEQERITAADLQRQLREVKAKLVAAEKAQPETKVETKTKEIFVLKDGQIDRLEKLNKQFEELFVRAGRDLDHFSTKATTQLNALFARRIEILNPINDAIAKTKLPAPSASLAQTSHPRPAATARPARLSSSPSQVETAAAGEDAGTPTGKLREIMIALAQNPDGLNARQIGARARVSTKGGSFSTFISRGRGAGWIRGTPSTLMQLSDAGIAALGHFDPLPTGRELFDYWMRDLGQSKSADIFRVLYERHPMELSTEEIGEAAQVSTKGGSFSTFMSRLKSRNLVVGGRGFFKIAPELFEN